MSTNSNINNCKRYRPVCTIRELCRPASYTDGQFKTNLNEINCDVQNDVVFTRDEIISPTGKNTSTSPQQVETQTPLLRLLL